VVGRNLPHFQLVEPLAPSRESTAESLPVAATISSEARLRLLSECTQGPDSSPELTQIILPQ
jgi:hypothetical protein